MVRSAAIIEWPAMFDNVARIKAKVTGQAVLPGDDELWILGSDMRVRAEADGTWIVWTIPRGFTTDGASIPWFATRLTGWRKWDPPQRLLRAEGASRFRAGVMWAAVRVFGGSAYRYDQTHEPMIFDSYRTAAP